MKILLVEDDIKMCEVVKDFLQDSGSEVQTAHNGNEGFVMFINPENSFDIIISDFNMPELNGIEFRNKIFDSPRECPPFIIYTGNVSGLNLKQCRGELYAVVDKPNFDLLEHHVAEIRHAICQVDVP